MRIIQIAERIMGFIIALCSVTNLIYCFVDAPSGISKIELITTCLIRQSLIFVPLVILSLIDFFCWVVRISKKGE